MLPDINNKYAGGVLLLVSYQQLLASWPLSFIKQVCLITPARIIVVNCVDLSTATTGDLKVKECHCSALCFTNKLNFVIPYPLPGIFAAVITLISITRAIVILVSIFIF